MQYSYSIIKAPAVDRIGALLAYKPYLDKKKKQNDR